MTQPIAAPGRRPSTGRSASTPNGCETTASTAFARALEASDLGALLVFDFNNIRYVTSTHIGEWARDKMTRFALLTRGGEPHLWDFGAPPSTTGCTARGCRRRTSEAG